MSKEDLQKLTVEKRHKTRWESAFLVSLRETANVSDACRSAKVARQTAYDLREKAEDFRAAWDEALEIACDKLELEARRRAHDGVTKSIFYKGEPIGQEINYSDTLMIFLLKAHRPDKYRDRHELVGKNGAELLTSLTVNIVK